MARKRQYWAFVWTHFNDGKYMPPLPGTIGPTRVDVKEAMVRYFCEPWESIKKRGGSIIKCTVTPNVEFRPPSPLLAKVAPATEGYASGDKETK